MPKWYARSKTERDWQPPFFFYRRISEQLQCWQSGELGFLQRGDIRLQRKPAEEDPNDPEKFAFESHRRQQRDRGVARQGRIELSSPLGSRLEFRIVRPGFRVASRGFRIE